MHRRLQQKISGMVFKNANPSTTLSRKSYEATAQKIAFKAPSGAGDPGGFEGYGAVYGNIDRDNEIIAPGAFAESLPAFIRDGFIACAHEWDEGVATVEAAYEDDYGLYIKCLFHGDAESQGSRIKTMERIERGKSVGLSVGFMPETWAYDEETGVRTITKATLYEVSIVTVPCNPLAQVVSAKSGTLGTIPATVREFEKFLRDSGYSKSLACQIASKGFAGGTLVDIDTGEILPEPVAEIIPANDDNEGTALIESLYLEFQAQQMGVR